LAETAILDDLMKRLADGDRSAFRPVFERLWGPTLRLCQGMLDNEADAADGAQAAMAKILERASDYDPARPALPWAMAIAAWECRTILRTRSRRREIPDDVTLEAASSASEDDFIRGQLSAAAVTAMGELSQADQDVLRATYWDCAAEVSGATLRKRRERALERLQKAFRRLYGLG
jgi:RNA polymerase sigma-70 factor (ECF subfamily)